MYSTVYVHLIKVWVDNIREKNDCIVFEKKSRKQKVQQDTWWLHLRDHVNYIRILIIAVQGKSLGKGGVAPVLLRSLSPSTVPLGSPVSKVGEYCCLTKLAFSRHGFHRSCVFHTRGSTIIHAIIMWFIAWFHVLVGYVNVEHECLSKETTREVAWNHASSRVV